MYIVRLLANRGRKNDNVDWLHKIKQSESGKLHLFTHLFIHFYSSIQCFHITMNVMENTFEIWNGIHKLPSNKDMNERTPVF